MLLCRIFTQDHHMRNFFLCLTLIWKRLRQRVCLGKMALELRVRNDVHVRRRILNLELRNETCGLKDMFDVLTQLSDLVQVDGVAPSSDISILLVDNAELYNASTLHFVNICGKIIHSPQFENKEVHLQAVKPVVQRTRNKFGVFDAVYSLNGNLLTCPRRKYTLFRGAPGYDEIKQLVSVVLHPDCVSSISLHMLVANVHLGRPVQIDSMQVIDALGRMGWCDVQVSYQHEDIPFALGFVVSNLNGSIIEARSGVSAHFCPKQLRVVICRRGSVNFFVSLGEMPFEEHAFVTRQVEYIVKSIVAILLHET